ncbi:MAG: hypothetical protein V3R80_03845 [Candidatus Tectomicrobia bacterium]
MLGDVAEIFCGVKNVRRTKDQQVGLALLLRLLFEQPPEERNIAQTGVRNDLVRI